MEILKSALECIFYMTINVAKSLGGFRKQGVSCFLEYLQQAGRGMGNLASETIWFTCRLPLQLLTARGNSAATAAVGQQSAVIR